MNRTKLRPAGCCQWPRIREGFGRITASRPSTCIDSFVTVPRPIQRVTSGLCRAACKRVYSCAYANRIPSRVRRLRPVCVYFVSPPFSLSLLHSPPFYAQPQRANLYTGYHKYEHTVARCIRWKTLTNFTLPSILRHKRDNQTTDFYANSRFYKNRESKRKLVSPIGYHNNAICFVYFAVFLLYLHFIWILRISVSSNSLCTREDARGEGNKLVTR